MMMMLTTMHDFFVSNTICNDLEVTLWFAIDQSIVIRLLARLLKIIFNVSSLVYLFYFMFVCFLELFCCCCILFYWSIWIQGDDDKRCCTLRNDAEDGCCSLAAIVDDDNDDDDDAADAFVGLVLLRDRFLVPGHCCCCWCGFRNAK